jgi:tetratricopeptide (TPR) repeat protein
MEAASLAGDVDQIAAARALIDRALTRFPGDPWLLHYRGYSLYREATVRMGRFGDDDVNDYLELAEADLAKSAARLPLPESYALLSSVIGQQIGSNPIKGMTHGPRSNKAMDKAIEVGPLNPRVWLLRGIGAIFTPKLFGGGTDKAHTYLTKAIQLFEQDKPVAPAPNWGRDEAWVWLGQVHEKEKRWDEAQAAYRKALEIEPRNDWVRMQLLPELQKRKGNGS